MNIFRTSPINTSNEYSIKGDRMEWEYWLWINNGYKPYLHNFRHEVDIWLLKLMKEAVNSLLRQSNEPVET